jgi:hypothetical protein
MEKAFLRILHCSANRAWASAALAHARGLKRIVSCNSWRFSEYAVSSPQCPLTNELIGISGWKEYLEVTQHGTTH